MEIEFLVRLYTKTLLSLTVLLAATFLAPEPLDQRGKKVSENWKKFEQKYTNDEIATGINTKESTTRVATLLTVIANDAIDVFNALT